MATQNQIGLHLDLSVRAVASLMADGILQRGWDVDACRVAYIRNLRERAGGRMSSSGDDLIAAKTRLAEAQADKTELEVKVFKGDLIPAAVVEQEWGMLVSAARAKFLALPSRAADAVMAASNVMEAHEILRKLVYEALGELVREQHRDEEGAQDGEDEEGDPA